MLHVMTSSSLPAGRQGGGDLFEEILLLSRKMLEEINAEDWEAMLVLEGRRQKMLQAYFSEPVSREEAERVADGIREMLDIDQSLMQKSRKMLETISGSLKNFKNGSSAVSAYQSNM